MDWLGNSLGDGLTSLKGQVSKLAKEVLSEDPLGTTSFEGRIKELESICDIHVKEIEKLRAENSRFKLGKSFELSDEQCQNICTLETKVSQLTAENVRLERLIDDLEDNHKKELELIFKDRETKVKSFNSEREVSDNCKEVDELKDAIIQLKIKNDALLEEIKSKNKDVLCYEKEVDSLKEDYLNLDKSRDREPKSALEDVNLLSGGDFMHHEGEIQHLKETLNEKENELQDTLSENKILRDELYEERRKFESCEEHYHADKVQLQSALLKEKEIADALKLQNIEYIQSNEELKSQALFLSNTIEKLQSTNFELIQKVKDFEAMKVEEHSQYTAIIDRLKEECSILTTQCEEHSCVSQEPMIINMEMKEKENLDTIQSLKIENESLILKLKNLSVDNDEKVSNLLQTIKNLQLHTEKVEKELVETKQEINLKTDEVASVQRLLELNGSLRNELDLLKLTEKQSSEENSKLKSSCEYLKSEHQNLQSQLQILNGNFETIKGELASFQEKIQVLEEEKCSLVNRLKIEEENMAGKVIVAADWLQSLEEEALQMIRCLGVSPSEPINVVSHLRSVNIKLSDLVADQRERSAVVHNTLGPEIRKLKGLVNRIRREFMLSSNERGLPDQHRGDFELQEDQNSGETLLTQSQTDDVKSLTQDVTQMTEIIGMIDRGLTSILQDKSSLEKELTIMRTLSSKTEKELISIARAKDAWGEERNQLLMSIQEKDSEIQALVVARDEAEAQVKSCTREQEALKEYIDSIEKANYFKRLDETKEVDEHIQQLEDLSNEQTPAPERDEIILNCNREINGYGEDQQNWKSISLELEKRCQHLEEVLRLSQEVQVEINVPDEKVIAELEDRLNRLQQENADLKGLVQQLRENIIAMASKNGPDMTGDTQVQQHRRSLSQGLADSVGGSAEGLRTELQLEQSRNQALTEKEVSLRKELERLRAHLLEVEEHYTSEALEREHAMNEYKAKLTIAEEQLRNSSTVYKSANVRSTQHLEALQSQIKLMSVQRDDLQSKLSLAEDQVQKHTAALTSLQMVLEQFQLDKERELQSAATKYNYQLQLAARHSAELEAEINALKSQLSEAQNGLKAGLRLSEQLEKKSHEILSLEEALRKKHDELLLIQKKVSALNESSAGKVDQFLVKNLVLGYLGASNGNTKTQALKIMATVLGLSEEEKIRIGVDSQSGWFSSLLHPSPGTSGKPDESLSQAFIRFLETESRPQPQLKLLPEASMDYPGSTPKRPPLVLSNLVLPTVTATPVSETPGSALKDVLKDS